MTFTGSSDTVFDSTGQLTVRDYNFDGALSFDESLCNVGISTISQVGPGATQDYGSFCFNFLEGNTGTLNFDAPIVINPSCTDAHWLYWAELSATSTNSPWPNGLQVAFDSENRVASWSIIPSATVSVIDGEEYEIEVFARLQDTDKTKLSAFKFTLLVTCCAAPTVFTPPSPPLSSYQYTIGQGQLFIVLSQSGQYQSPVSCCTPLPVLAPLVSKTLPE